MAPTSAVKRCWPSTTNIASPTSGAAIATGPNFTDAAGVFFLLGEQQWADRETAGNAVKQAQHVRRTPALRPLKFRNPEFSIKGQLQ